MRCTLETSKKSIKPKIIASTATIRGATQQAESIYGKTKDELQLFPNPGLDISDSFFGRYARDNHTNEISQGRLYLGINAPGYRSFLTAQVRTFSAAMFRAGLLDMEKKDAWWTLLTFYNSLRELGGARTLFNSDIAARMKDYAFKYGQEKESVRYLNRVEELTSRRSQAELVKLLDQLAKDWSSRDSLDACLASNIIEVGVDIDRLSLMAVVGQPKTTAQYIQVTGRVGRRWWDRPGLVLMMYNPNKSRDLSHFEQFQSYHQRLYEQVEPTSATPFSIETIRRAAAGILLLWARQKYSSKSPGESFVHYKPFIKEARDLLIDRCQRLVRDDEECNRVVSEIDDVYLELIMKGESMNPQLWWEYPQKKDGEYLMLWTGEYAPREQRDRAVKVLSSMRNVDSSARLDITSMYFIDEEF